MLWEAAVEAISARLGSGTAFPSSSRQTSSGIGQPPAGRVVGGFVGVVEQLGEQRDQDRPQQLGAAGVGDHVHRVLRPRGGAGPVMSVPSAERTTVGER